jgi:hypothetical protein
MAQINTLNQDPHSAAASLQHSINKNFDTLRESLVHCSRIVCQNETAQTTATLKKKVIALQEEINRAKVEVKQEMKETIQNAKENA